MRRDFYWNSNANESMMKKQKKASSSPNKVNEKSTGEKKASMQIELNWNETTFGALAAYS